METILWSDGHTSSISEEEAYYEAVLIYKDVYEKNKEQK